MNWNTLISLLDNWGEWLCYDNRIKPDQDRCMGIESQCLRDAGDVWEPDPVYSVPDITAAHKIQDMIDRLYRLNKLNLLERYSLEVRYGGLPAVIRPRRMSPSALKHLAENAEKVLHAAFKKANV